VLFLIKLFISSTNGRSNVFTWLVGWLIVLSVKEILKTLSLNVLEIFESVCVGTKNKRFTFWG